MVDREGYGSALEGHWEDATGTVMTISDSTLTAPDGRSLKLAITSEGKCSFQRGRHLYEGKLTNDGNCLVWPGGTVWVRSLGGPASSSTRVEAAQRCSTTPPFTLDDALGIQRDLYEAFSAAAFQSRLQELERRSADQPEALTAERTSLLLTVQGPILAKYGFEPDQKGIIDMLEAGARFKHNTEYESNCDRLDRLLGSVDLGCGLRVVVRHVFEDAELEVVLPRRSTFRDLRAAISKAVQSDAVLRDGHLVKQEADGAYSAYKDQHPVSGTEEVFLFRASLRSQ